MRKQSLVYFAETRGFPCQNEGNFRHNNK